MKSRTSAGVERHAQSFVTSFQPDGSASPKGIKQLNMPAGTVSGRALVESCTEQPSSLGMDRGQSNCTSSNAVIE